jgi:hypothetical protein
MSSEVLAGLGNGAPLFDNSITNDSSSTVNPSWGGSPIPRANPCDDPPMKGKNGFNQQQHQDQGLTTISGQPLTHEHHPAGSPKRERGLSHVVSLPSVKTHSSATVVGIAVCSSSLTGLATPMVAYSHAQLS